MCLVRQPTKKLRFEDIHLQLDRIAEVFRQHKEVMDFFTYSNQASLAKKRRMIKAERNFVNQCFAKYKQAVEGDDSAALLAEDIKLLASQFQVSCPKGSQSQLDPLNNRDQTNLNPGFELQVQMVPAQSPPALKSPMNQTEATEKPAKVSQARKTLQSIEPPNYALQVDVPVVDGESPEANRKQEQECAPSSDQSKEKTVSAYSPSAPNFRLNTNESPKDLSQDESSSKKHKDSDELVDPVRLHNRKKKEHVRRQSDVNFQSRPASLNMKKLKSNYVQASADKKSDNSQASIDQSNSEELSSPLQLRAKSGDNNFLSVYRPEAAGETLAEGHSLPTSEYRMRPTSSSQSIRIKSIFYPQSPGIEEEDSEHDEMSNRHKRAGSLIPKMNLVDRVDELKQYEYDYGVVGHGLGEGDENFSTPRELDESSLEAREALKWPAIPPASNKRQSNSGLKSNIYLNRKSTDGSGLMDGLALRRRPSNHPAVALAPLQLDESRQSAVSLNNSQLQFVSPRELVQREETPHSLMGIQEGASSKKRTYTFSLPQSTTNVPEANLLHSLELPQSRDQISTARTKPAKMSLAPVKIEKAESVSQAEVQQTHGKRSPFFPAGNSSVPRFEFAEKISNQHSFAGSLASPRELRDLRAKLEALELQKATLAKEKQSLMSKLRASEQVLAGYKSQSAEMKRELEEYSDRQLAYESKLAVAEARISQVPQLEKSLQAAQEIIRQYKGVAAQKASTNMGSEDLNAELSELKVQKQRLEDQRDALLARTDALVAENETLRLNSSCQDASRQRLLEERMAQLQAKLAASVSAKSVLEARVAELAQANRLLESQVEESENKCQEFASDLQLACDRQSAAEAKLLTSDKKLTVKDLEAKELSVRLETLKMAYKALDDRHASVLRDRDALQEQAARLAEENRLLVGKVDQLEQCRPSKDKCEVSAVRNTLVASQLLASSQIDQNRLLSSRNQELEYELSKLAAEKQAQEKLHSAAIVENSQLRHEVEVLNGKVSELSNVAAHSERELRPAGTVHQRIDGLSVQPFDRVIKETGSQWARDAKRQNAAQLPAEEPFLSRTESRRDFFNADFELERLNISASLDQAEQEATSRPLPKIDIDTAVYEQELGGLLASIDRAIEQSHRCSEPSFALTADLKSTDARPARLTSSEEMPSQRLAAATRASLRNYAAFLTALLPDNEQLSNFKRSCVDRRESFYSSPLLKLSLVDAKVVSRSTCDPCTVKFSIAVVASERVSLDLVRLQNYSRLDLSLESQPQYKNVPMLEDSITFSFTISVASPEFVVPPVVELIGSKESGYFDVQACVPITPCLFVGSRQLSAQHCASEFNRKGQEQITKSLGMIRKAQLLSRRDLTRFSEKQRLQASSLRNEYLGSS